MCYEYLQPDHFPESGHIVREEVNIDDTAKLALENYFVNKV
ncbi:hypothetical protein FACS189437_10050 [Bacteroidia bacterium]|nr:hypothetical protein FACS189437_10050 [Bacteroidia bacterium]